MSDSRENPKILFVEDDLNLQKSIAYILEERGYKVICTSTGEEAVELAKKEDPDLLLLDLMLPGIDGFGVCEILKKDRQTEKILVVMLTGRKMVDEIVSGLDLYADDYIVKPFDPRILIARIGAVLRRKQKTIQHDKSLLKLKDLTIDLKGYVVRVSGNKIELTKTEFDIIALLASRPNQVFTRANVLQQVREDDYPITERVVDYQITGIRKKLGKLGNYIKTVRGVGYKFEI